MASVFNEIKGKKDNARAVFYLILIPKDRVAFSFIISFFVLNNIGRGGAHFFMTWIILLFYIELSSIGMEWNRFFFC